MIVEKFPKNGLRVKKIEIALLYRLKNNNTALSLISIYFSKNSYTSTFIEYYKIIKVSRWKINFFKKDRKKWKWKKIISLSKTNEKKKGGGKITLIKTFQGRWYPDDLICFRILYLNLLKYSVKFLLTIE